MSRRTLKERAHARDTKVHPEGCDPPPSEYSGTASIDVERDQSIKEVKTKIENFFAEHFLKKPCQDFIKDLFELRKKDGVKYAKDFDYCLFNHVITLLDNSDFLYKDSLRKEPFKKRIIELFYFAKESSNEPFVYVPSFRSSSKVQRIKKTNIHCTEEPEHEFITKKIYVEKGRSRKPKKYYVKCPIHKVHIEVKIIRA